MVGVRGTAGGIDHVGAEVLSGDHVARQHGLAWIQRVQASRTVVRNNGHVRKSQPLTKAFVTAVQERFIFFDRTSQRAAKLVPLERRDPLSSQSLTRGIEKVPGVQRAIAQKLEERTVQSIGAGLRDNADLRACPLAVFGRVGIGHHIEFPDGVNVMTDAYSAEYGKRAGAQVSVVTQSGSNTLHGSLFEFLRNSALDARNFFDPPSEGLGGKRIPPFKRNQFGGSLGGPIKKDKAFLYGSYEGFRQRLGLPNVAIVPDDSARGLNPLYPGKAMLPCNVVTRQNLRANVIDLSTGSPYTYHY